MVIKDPYLSVMDESVVKSDTNDNVPPEVVMGWETEECFQDHQNIFQGLLKDINQAKTSICMEMFIFSLDEVGKTMLNALKEAYKRGVSIKLVVDGVGSQEFTQKVLKELFEAGVHVRVYKPVFSFLTKFNKYIFSFRFKAALYLLLQMNKRNHRKIVLIDDHIAWVGSSNISNRYVSWRETMIKVTGDNVKLIGKGFDWVWNCAAGIKRKRFSQNFSQAIVCHTLSWKNKRKAHKFRLDFIRNAKTSIKVVNPYFVPPYRFLVALLRARHRGVEVSLLTTEVTDIVFVRWFARSYYKILLKSGIQVYEYQKRMLHSKVIIADDKAIIGTSNYNYRSVNLDLEIDILVQKKETLKVLKEQWEKDIQNSKKIPQAPYSKMANYFLSFLEYLKRNS